MLIVQNLPKSVILYNANLFQIVQSFQHGLYHLLLRISPTPPMSWAYSSAATPKTAAPTTPKPTPCTLSFPSARALEEALVAAAEALDAALLPLAAMEEVAALMDEEALLRAEEIEAEAEEALPVILAAAVPLELPLVAEAVELAEQPAEAGCTDSVSSEGRVVAVTLRSPEAMKHQQDRRLNARKRVRPVDQQRRSSERYSS